MSPPRSPCYKCEERSPGCHGSCEIYKNWIAENEDKKSKNNTAYVAYCEYKTKKSFIKHRKEIR